MTRPSATENQERAAAEGRVTLQEAARRAGVSRTTAYRQIKRDRIAYTVERDVLTIAEEDVHLIQPRTKKTDDPRVATMVRVPKARHAAWAKAAGKQPVSVWLGELADRASGWEDGK